MQRPAFTHSVPRGLHPLVLATPSQYAEALPAQLDALWHFECVVSPRSSPSLPSSPRSPTSPPPAQPSSPRSPAAIKPSPSPSSRPPSSRFSPSADQRNSLQRVFSTFDENGDGNVTPHEISRIFEKLGISNSDDSLHPLMETSSYVDEQEFLQLYESVCNAIEQLHPGSTASSPSLLDDDLDEDLRAVFQVFDKDGNGFISPTELQSVLCSLGFSQASQLDACVEMIARVDENGDGQVDFFEFKKLFHDDNPSVIIQSF